MHEEFINLPNRLAQLVIPAPHNVEIHMDPISIDHDEYEGSSDDTEFDEASSLGPIVDNKHTGQSGHEPRTPSDLHITSDASSHADEDIDTVQRMDIDAPHTRIHRIPRERETDPTINDPTTSSSTISADPAKKVLEPRSKVVDQPTPAPVCFSARLAEKRGHTTYIIDDSQPSVHTIFTVDPVDANPDPANDEDALSRWGHARWRLACHDDLTKMDQYDCCR
jgi:hypothetical protein